MRQDVPLSHRPASTPCVQPGTGDTQHTHQAKRLPDRGIFRWDASESLEKAKATLSEDEMPELPQHTVGGHDQNAQGEMSKLSPVAF